jgi:hypothetical protein
MRSGYRRIYVLLLREGWRVNPRELMVRAASLLAPLLCRHDSG